MGAGKSIINRWEEAISTMPLIAILRGVRPAEVIVIADALIQAGIGVVEVPLNSPSPFESIKLLTRAHGDRIIVGAGTVLNLKDVDALKEAGGQICISPNADPRIIRKAKELDLISLPGFFTATEAFSAIEAGADGLKLFPAELSGSIGLRALKAVLPKSIHIFPVGGICTENMEQFLLAGASGFGLGSNLFKPGDLPKEVYSKATKMVMAWRTRS